MLRPMMKQRMTMAACVVAVTLIVSSLAVADDDDYYRRGNPSQAHQYGYQSGYQDGLRKGRHEARENDPNDFQSREWREANHGYQSWMGPFPVFQDGYRDGYRQGFQEAFNQRFGQRYYGDRDGDRYGYRGSDYGGGSYGNWASIAYNNGLEDGVAAGREDAYRGKQFNSNPRGSNHADRGYVREYGDKDGYRARYSEGYRAGYERTYGRRY